MKRKIYNNGFYDYYYKCQECGCESISLRHLGGFQPPDLVCDYCGVLVIDNRIQIEKSNRKKAIEWWNNLDDSMKMNLCRIHFSMRSVSGISVIKSLTGREIEQIWRKETQQESFEDISVDVMREYKNSILKEKRSQVDFEMLRDAVFRSIPAMFGKHHQWGNHVENLQLFFDLLSKSSTFAHKAHKELNKLMK